MSEIIRQCIERMEQSRARLAAGLASLTLTVDRWQPSSAISEMRHGMALEPALLPKHKRRGTWRLENGRIMDVPKAHTVQTTYMRRDWNENDVALLHHIVEMQPRTFTFEQITAERKFKASANQIERVRKGKL